jgi:RING-variant domain
MLKRRSHKDKKISGKFPVIESTQTFCWICHQDTTSAELKMGRTKSLQSNFSRPVQPYFRPCLCKGSMSFVHKECLNRWALEKYNCIVKKPGKSNEEDLPPLSCPNCKTPYVYNLHEYKQRSGLKGLKINSAESICLILLIVLQIWVLFYQFVWSPSPEGNATEGKIAESKRYLEWSDYIHVFTVIVVLLAGAFNLLENACTELRIEVLNQF